MSFPQYESRDRGPYPPAAVAPDDGHQDLKNNNNNNRQQEHQQKEPSAPPPQSLLPTRVKSYSDFFEAKGYTFGRIVGEGTYCKVRLATRDATKYAVKIIDRRNKSEEFLTKFLPRELEIIQKLNHPNVIKTYEVYECKSHVFIFMEPVERGDLLDYVKSRTRLSEPEARFYFLQLTAAIKYLHDLAICHRDLKCENILLTTDGVIKIIDFGFCRYCRNAEGKRLLSETFCGSTAYAAPEVIVGEPYNPMLNDVWSMGCVLYIMVTGIMPFDDSDVRKMLRMQFKRMIRQTNSMSLLSTDVKDLYGRMLEPDVTRRIPLPQVINHPWCRSAPDFSKHHNNSW